MAKRKGSKSEAIRKYMTDNPNASVKDVSTALKVQPALVYNVRSTSKMTTPKGGPKKKKKSTVSRTRATDGGGDSIDTVLAAIELIKNCGGVAEARKALTLAERVTNAVN